LKYLLFIHSYIYILSTVAILAQDSRDFHETLSSRTPIALYSHRVWPVTHNLPSSASPFYNAK